jgi:ParB-like chromosome segregation protein Spo0J
MNTIRKAKFWPEENMKIKDLKAAMAPYNPRAKLEPGMPEWQALVDSIQDHGFVDHGIVYNKRTNRLVGGHQRVAVLDEEFKVTEVPVVIVDVDEWQERAMNVALNNPKIGGHWDMPKLQVLLEEIQANSPDAATMTGYTEEDIKRLLNEMGFDKIPDEIQTFDENMETEHTCPKCGYRYSD